MKTYPDKFVEWLLMFAHSEIEDDEFKWEIMVEDHVLDYLTTEEAFKFWKKNRKKYR